MSRPSFMSLSSFPKEQSGTTTTSNPFGLGSQATRVRTGTTRSPIQSPVSSVTGISPVAMTTTTTMGSGPARGRGPSRSARDPAFVPRTLGRPTREFVMKRPGVSEREQTRLGALNSRDKRRIVGEIVSLDSGDMGWVIHDSVLLNDVGLGREVELVMIGPSPHHENRKNYESIMGVCIDVTSRVVANTPIGNIPVAVADSLDELHFEDYNDAGVVSFSNTEGETVSLNYHIKSGQRQLLMSRGYEGVLLSVFLYAGHLMVVNRHRINLLKSYFANSEPFALIFAKTGLREEHLFPEQAMYSNRVYTFMLMDQELALNTRQIIGEKPYLVYLGHYLVSGYSKLLEHPVIQRNPALIQYFTADQRDLDLPEVLSQAYVPSGFNLYPHSWPADAPRIERHRYLSVDEANDFLKNGFHVPTTVPMPQDLDVRLRDGESVVIGGIRRIEIGGLSYEQLELAHLYSTSFHLRRQSKDNSRNPISSFLRNFVSGDFSREHVERILAQYPLRNLSSNEGGVSLVDENIRATHELALRMKAQGSPSVPAHIEYWKAGPVNMDKMKYQSYVNEILNYYFISTFPFSMQMKVLLQVNEFIANFVDKLEVEYNDWILNSFQFRLRREGKKSDDQLKKANDFGVKAFNVAMNAFTKETTAERKLAVYNGFNEKKREEFRVYFLQIVRNELVKKMHPHEAYQIYKELFYESRPTLS